ncbi:transcriptional regulator, TetR family [Atopostipes suicloacalis DSM 15692]|uniref:Transcriptional regulator, TetR family n=1 Tax=Atopostipes suicloacalis DSM 15692 TaxID=1121025 RepID=A0A1M4V2H6_9LACT|nr:TetR/AcrR family transcriptional regulator [Atopostipes suicloacalis]SHE63073.1 transcriptional regulator, TetR family [Atopostipes suicloacalis DSM 15692]
MEQKRKTNTKENIKKAFIQLIKDKGFDSLTVSDLAREANINRGTFYLHYLDKYDLLDKLEMDIIEDLKEILLTNLEHEETDEPAELIPYEKILEALNYIKKDYHFIEALAGDGGDPNFIQKVENVISEMIQSKLQETDNQLRSKEHLPADYAEKIFLSSVVTIIELWIEKGTYESPEQIARIITQAKQISPFDLLI